MCLSYKYNNVSRAYVLLYGNCVKTTLKANDIEVLNFDFILGIA